MSQETPEPAGRAGSPSGPTAPHAPAGSEVVLIAMVAANGVIGDGEDQPWHLREDLRRFLRLTKGHPVVMGRRTWDAIGTALPGRPAVVLTRDPDWAAEAARAAADPQRALDLAAALPGGELIWVLGGGQVYDAMLPAATRVELTEVDAPASGETRFPRLPPGEWLEAERDDRLAFAFVTYRRREASAGDGRDHRG
ncbi:MAG: dihydrofolate reductase [Austwickia sp.]|jgi:dihydrofolate reductase|nr:MAG: dihydrofolate reductase [Austwickia sp.]